MISVNERGCNGCGKCVSVCPFSAIELKGGKASITSACKICKLCIKACPEKCIELATVKQTEDISQWSGAIIYVEHECGRIHPVTFELIGKAKQLMQERGKNETVSCVFIGSGIENEIGKLFEYGAENVYVYDNPGLEYFRADVYANAMTDCINEAMPNIVLIGATSVGRSLAPRVATRFKTGLTADCTTLEIRNDGGLVQIRPAFGGNIMAQILTKHRRPQFATVRYKVMEAAERQVGATGNVIKRELSEDALKSGIEIMGVSLKEKVKSISDADVLVVAGRGVKTRDDLALVSEFADLIGAEMACTRPMVEQGMVDNSRQIGLSGRTVKPKLIITFGVSGAIQFVAGMQNSELIISVNKDKNAPIFKLSHYGFVGDLSEILPMLIKGIKEGV